MTEVVPPYNEEQLLSDSVSKKDLVTFLQDHASVQFVLDHKLAGAAKNVIKTKTKEHLIDDYKQLFATKAFKIAGEELTATSRSEHDAATPHGNEVAQHGAQKTKKEAKIVEPVKYTKKIIKVGDRTTFPKKGDLVECFYTGKLDSGKVFDTNVDDGKKEGRKKGLPLKFYVGVGKVIRGWDEALLTMSVGEKAEVVIQPEWAYGKKGIEGKVPPNSVLTFEVELVCVSG